MNPAKNTFQQVVSDPTLRDGYLNAPAEIAKIPVDPSERMTLGEFADYFKSIGEFQPGPDGQPGPKHQLAERTINGRSVRVWVTSQDEANQSYGWGWLPEGMNRWASGASLEDFLFRVLRTAHVAMQVLSETETHYPGMVDTERAAFMSASNALYLAMDYSIQGLRVYRDSTYKGHVSHTVIAQTIATISAGEDSYLNRVDQVIKTCERMGEARSNEEERPEAKLHMSEHFEECRDRHPFTLDQWNGIDQKLCDGKLKKVDEPCFLSAEESGLGFPVLITKEGTPIVVNMGQVDPETGIGDAKLYYIGHGKYREAYYGAVTMGASYHASERFLVSVRDLSSKAKTALGGLAYEQPHFKTKEHNGLPNVQLHHKTPHQRHLVVPFYDMGPLARWESTELSEAQKFWIFSDVMLALQVLHEAGFHHGCISAQQIFLENESKTAMGRQGTVAASLLGHDFLSWGQQDTSVLFQSLHADLNLLMERAGLGGRVDPKKSDLYSLGSTMWKMIEGTDPLPMQRRGEYNRVLGLILKEFNLEREKLDPKTLNFLRRAAILLYDNDKEPLKKMGELPEGPLGPKIHSLFGPSCPIRFTRRNFSALKQPDPGSLAFIAYRMMDTEAARPDAGVIRSMLERYKQRHPEFDLAK